MIYHTYGHNGFKVEVPQYFTPNGDGLNDVFFPKVDSANSGISSYKLTVSSGCKDIFITDIVEKGWDGVYKESRYKKGKYKFELSITWEDGVTETFKEKFEFVID